jgi:hypothetical protein
MSSLIFYTDAENILVATDTLAVKAAAGEPLMFCSKAMYVPHLRLIIAGTGVGMFSGDWAMTVNNRMVVRDILHLDYHAPEQLRSSWQQFRSEYPVPDDMTTTVYHFGLSEADEVCSFAYRSTNNFSSERLQYGTGTKPACALPTVNVIEDLRLMMNEQRATEAQKPAEKRVYIGGECIAMHLTKAACNVWSAFKFEDYEQQLESIFLNYSRQK